MSRTPETRNSLSVYSVGVAKKCVLVFLRQFLKIWGNSSPRTLETGPDPMLSNFFASSVLKVANFVLGQDASPKSDQPYPPHVQ